MVHQVPLLPANRPHLRIAVSESMQAPAPAGVAVSCNADAIALKEVANTTLKYLEVVDNGNNSIAPGTIGYFSGSNTVTVTHMFARNAGCVYFIPIGNNQIGQLLLFLVHRDEWSGYMPPTIQFVFWNE